MRGHLATTGTMHGIASRSEWVRDIGRPASDRMVMVTISEELDIQAHGRDELDVASKR